MCNMHGQAGSPSDEVAALLLRLAAEELHTNLPAATVDNLTAFWESSATGLVLTSGIVAELSKIPEDISNASVSWARPPALGFTLQAFSETQTIVC
ncbi:hypothetical protein [Sorangium sp. So ce406]|uniref:hypothetical protein n=1 Tax=Sorangium sp. So ce406 TaxID=3133311 RepID=UPI003F5AF01F